MGLQELRDKIKKAAKGVHVSILSESNIAISDTWVQSPSYDLNRILSGSLFKGIRSRKFTVLVGPEASFKSSFAAICLAHAQSQGYEVIVIDTEGSWTVDFCKRWGLDPTKMLYIYTPWVDDIMVILGQIIGDEKPKEKKKKEEKSKKNKAQEEEAEAIEAEEVSKPTAKYALALDSIGGLESMKLIDDAEKGDVKADQGLLQKKIKRILKMIVNICKSKDSLGFAAAHYYGNPSGYGDPQQVGGGFYLKLSADYIIATKKTKIYENESKGADVTGTEITLITLKNREYPPFHEALLEIDYIKGINPYAGLLPIAIDAKIISQGGAWYTHTASGTKVQGSDNVNQIFIDHPEILKELDDWVAKTGYSTINETVKEIEETKEPPKEETNGNGKRRKRNGN